MDIESQKVYNNTIDHRELIKEDHLKNASSLGNRTQTYHTRSERYHTTSTLQGF